MRHNPALEMDTRDYPSSPKFIDLSGRRFGRLSVVRYAGTRARKPYFSCQCDCGQSLTVCGVNLSTSRTSSCGCLHSEIAKEATATHGESRVGKRTPEYRTWIQMKTRCENPNYREFHYYGGRGIKVCERWSASFESFLSDVGRKPSPQYSIDRWPDVNGHYEPGNVRWATNRQQAENRRKK